MSFSALKQRLKWAIKWIAPPVLLIPFRAPRSAPEPDAPPSWHRGDYSTWGEAAAAAEGYHVTNILDIQRNAMRKVRDGLAVYERDSVLFDEIEYFFPTLAALLLVASRNGNRLSVLDFGGALGSSYYQNRHMLSHLVSLKWQVVEQVHFVDTGRAEFRNNQLDFQPTIEAARDASAPDVVLLSSVLQYLDDPFAMLKAIADLDAPYILVDRTPILDEGRERIVVQTVPPSIYPATYACRLFAPGAIEEALADRYEPRFRFEAHVGTTIEVDKSRARYHGIFFERRKPN